MARQVLPIVGLVVGAYFGNPQLGYMIGSVIGNAVDPQVLQGPKIGDAGVQTSAEGVYCPIIYGTAPCSGNIICRGGRTIRTRRDRASKGGGPITETERVYWTYAIRICAGPVAGVTRIWEDEKLVYDIRPQSKILQESAEFKKRFKLYLGGEGQLPDPSLESFLGAGNVPSYRGRCYIVFGNYDLTDRRESIPNYRFEVAAVVTGSFTPSLIADEKIFTGSGDQLSETRSAGWAIPAAGTISISSDSNYIASGNGVAPFLNLRKINSSQTSYDEVALPSGAPTGSVFSTAFHPSSKFIAVSFSIPGSNDGIPNARLRIYGFDSGAFVQVSEADGSGVGGITFSPDGTRLAWVQGKDTVTNGLRLYNFNTTTGELQFPVFASGNHNAQSAYRFNFSPNGRYLAEENNGKLVIWDASGPVVLAAQIAPSGNPSSGRGAHWSPDGRYVYTISASAVGANSVSRYEFLPYNALPISPTFPPQPPGLAMNSSATSDGRFIALARSGSIGAALYLYQVDMLTMQLVPLAIQPSTTANTILSVAWSPKIGIEQQQGGASSLSSIVISLHKKAKHSPGAYNTAEMTDSVDGVTFAGDYTIASAIRSLLTPYFFDASEYSGKIHYIKRGKAVVKTLTIKDIVDEPEESMRENQIEYPRVLHMSYQNPLIGYAPAKATSTRESPDVRVVGEASAQVPVVYSNVSEAAQVANKLHKIAWAEAGGPVTFSVTDEHLDLVNADCIGLSLRGQVKRLRIVTTVDDPGVRKLTCRIDRQSAMTSNLTGVPLPPPNPPPQSIVGPTTLAILDIPGIFEGDDAMLYRVGAAGITDVWAGATVQRSENGGASYGTVASFALGTVIGQITEYMHDASEHYTDTTNLIKLQLLTADDIDSLTETEFLSRGGAFAVQSPDGSWEIMQYRDSLQLTDKTYVLSNLLRGRLNTQTNSHALGALVVFLEYTKAVPIESSMIGRAITHRAVSNGLSPETAYPQTSTFYGKSQTEWPVANLLLLRSANTITATAVPRHRFGTEINPVRSIHWTAYRWTATAGANTITKETVTDATTFDVTGWSAPVTVTVAQVNRYTGAGPSVSEAIL